MPRVTEARRPELETGCLLLQCSDSLSPRSHESCSHPGLSSHRRRESPGSHPQRRLPAHAAPRRRRPRASRSWRPARPRWRPAWPSCRRGRRRALRRRRPRAPTAAAPRRRRRRRPRPPTRTTTRCAPGFWRLRLHAHRPLRLGSQSAASCASQQPPRTERRGTQICCAHLRRWPRRRRPADAHGVAPCRVMGLRGMLCGARGVHARAASLGALGRSARRISSGQHPGTAVTALCADALRRAPAAVGRGRQGAGGRWRGGGRRRARRL